MCGQGRVSAHARVCPQDCFYASVFEHENPRLKHLPLAVQQKHIVVTCNYEARRRGLYKLQLIHQAKSVCPDVVIVLGEDLTRFRNASKDLYAFLRSFSWNARCEKLGFDEVFLDVTDIIDYNVSNLNFNHLSNAFFCLAKDDPTVGFAYDASRLTGHLHPKTASANLDPASLDPLHLRLALGSHLAEYLRTRLESDKGYTATVGISTNKLLAKLVGNTYKPNAQTTLVPPYISDGEDESEDNVTSFMDSHDVSQIPGIGYKIAQGLRAYVRQRPADFGAEPAYDSSKETMLVHDVRTHAGIGPETLERVLGGPNVPRGIGVRVWGLLNGCDEAEVGQARDVPAQISIEDSYIRLDSFDAVVKELRLLANKLIQRMQTDLLDEEDEEDEDDVQRDATISSVTRAKRWLAHPKAIRLSTRPRRRENSEGSRNRSFARISKSSPMPTFVFNLKESVDVVVDRLLSETLVPLFRRLHPEQRGWNLSLINIAATNITEAAREQGGVGRDISKMFRRQDEVLRQWKVEETAALEAEEVVEGSSEWPERRREFFERVGSEDVPTRSQERVCDADNGWESEEDDTVGVALSRCEECRAVMPPFAMGAHGRWHAQSGRGN